MRSIVSATSAFVVACWAASAWSAPEPADAAGLAVFDEAVAAYEDGRAADAEAGFARLVREGHATPTVLFNLGNAAYRQRRWPAAVLAYEWALTLDPRDVEAKDNLALARDKLVVDETPSDIGPDAQRALEALEAVPTSLTSTLFVGLWTLGCLLVARRIVKGPEVTTWPAVLALVTALVVASHVAWKVTGVRAAPRGVLQAPAVEVKSGPGPGYETLFTLHAGTVVRQRDARGAWARVEVPHGPGGWIESSHLALIGRPETLPTPH